MKLKTLLLLLLFFVGCDYANEETIDKPIHICPECPELFNLATDYYQTRWLYRDLDTIKIYKTNHYGLEKIRTNIYKREVVEGIEGLNDTLGTWRYGATRLRSFTVVKYVKDSITFDTVCYEIKRCDNEND